MSLFGGWWWGGVYIHFCVQPNYSVEVEAVLCCCLGCDKSMILFETNTDIFLLIHTLFGRAENIYKINNNLDYNSTEVGVDLIIALCHQIRLNSIKVTSWSIRWTTVYLGEFRIKRNLF